MKKSIHAILNILIFSLIFSGAGPRNSIGDVGQNVPEKNLEKIQKNKSIFHSSYYLKKADAYTNNDELQLALLFLKIAAALNPDDIGIIVKISELKRSIDIGSNKHFKAGKKFYLQKDIDEARKQFLTALRYNPDHKIALDYLKNKLISKEYINYTFRKNDSLKIISNKFYKDPELVFLIAYFNDLKTETEPKPGDILKIPVLEPEINPAVDHLRLDIISAKNLLEQKRFKETLVITQKILEKDPLNKDAIQLNDDAYYQIGIQLINQEKNFEAIDTLKKITHEYEGKNGAIQKAIQHELLNAKNLLNQKKYEESKCLAEKILSYDRTNPVAESLIKTSRCQQGKDLLIHKKFDEALQILDQADPGDNCAKKMRLAVQKAIKEQAEAHYLRGVKHFLNEELQSAIKEWEKTLKLNPEHNKAEKNIINAKSLLEKLKKVK